MTWLLIILVGSAFGGVSDVKSVPMTELQCKRAVEQMKTFRGKIAVTCVGPNGEKFDFEDVNAG